MKSALDQEQWDHNEMAHRCEHGTLFAYIAGDGQSMYPWGTLAVGWNGDIRATTPEAGHALAALALWAQPFGFRHQDVANLRRVAGEHEWAARLAERIEALLPPLTREATDG